MQPFKCWGLGRAKAKQGRWGRGGAFENRQGSATNWVCKRGKGEAMLKVSVLSAYGTQGSSLRVQEREAGKGRVGCRAGMTEEMISTLVCCLEALEKRPVNRWKCIVKLRGKINVALSTRELEHITCVCSPEPPLIKVDKIHL